MAVYRESPKCIFCGEVIAEAIYRQQAAHESPIYGDLFLRWEYFKHECKKQKEFQEKLKNK